MRQAVEHVIMRGRGEASYLAHKGLVQSPFQQHHAPGLNEGAGRVDAAALIAIGRGAFTTLSCLRLGSSCTRNIAKEASNAKTWFRLSPSLVSVCPLVVVHFPVRFVPGQ
jgi:hypothetical protein